MNSSSKTPVSILNEFFIHRGITPKFDQLPLPSQPTNPMFAFALTCGKHSVVGEGRSKQQAKHAAAKLMLTKLNIGNEEEFKDDIEQYFVPHEDNLGHNAVGMLMDYCKKKVYPEPQYIDLYEAGPPHAKIFTVKCRVSKLSTIGETRTKKQAKHIAAHKMLLKLQESAGEESMPVVLFNTSHESVSPKLDDDKLKPVPTFQPQAFLYKDHYKAYLSLGELSPTVTDLIQNKLAYNENNAYEIVQKISNELSVQVTVDSFSNTSCDTSLDSSLNTSSPTSEDDQNKLVVVISLGVSPEITSIGDTLKSAAENLLNYIKIFSSN